MALYPFTVVGAGAFPAELMELEGCRPSTPQAAAAIEASGFRRVDLESDAPPNHVKWADAGWMVRNLDIELPSEGDALKPDAPPKRND